MAEAWPCTYVSMFADIFVCSLFSKWYVHTQVRVPVTSTWYEFVYRVNGARLIKACDSKSRVARPRPTQGAQL